MCATGYVPKGKCTTKCTATQYVKADNLTCVECNTAKGSIPKADLSGCKCTAADAKVESVTSGSEDCSCKTASRFYGTGDKYKQTCDKTCHAKLTFANTAGLATCTCASAKFMTTNLDDCTACGDKAVCNGTVTVTCKTSDLKVKTDKTNCEAGCTADPNGEMLLWVTDACECPTG